MRIDRAQKYSTDRNWQCFLRFSSRIGPCTEPRHGQRKYFIDIVLDCGRQGEGSRLDIRAGVDESVTSHSNAIAEVQHFPTALQVLDATEAIYCIAEL